MRLRGAEARWRKGLRAVRAGAHSRRLIHHRVHRRGAGRGRVPPAQGLLRRGACQGRALRGGVGRAWPTWPGPGGAGWFTTRRRPMPREKGVGCVHVATMPCLHPSEPAAKGPLGLLGQRRLSCCGVRMVREAGHSARQLDDDVCDGVARQTRHLSGLGSSSRKVPGLTPTALFAPATPKRVGGDWLLQQWCHAHLLHLRRLASGTTTL
jgi:hypothetical protein